MKNLVFSCGFGLIIDDFICQKRASGYPYTSSARLLLRFDRLVADKYPNEYELTKEMCLEWIRLNPEEHSNSLLRRVTPVRQLGKYMKGLGHEAYVVPNHIPNKQLKYEPHIYTDTELKAFFASIDSCLQSPFSPTRRYVIPTIFRLLYCCGLRSSEARLLTRTDVDLETGKIVIRESKGWKSRIVYMSADLLEVCREYDAIMNLLFPGRLVFFPNKDGGCFSKTTIDCWFHEFWDKLPVCEFVTGNPARVHDFRHGYAVHRLNQWVREGQDLNALYPYLSQYMGHSNYADTDYYLSLVEEFYPDMERMLTNVNDGILPEVYSHEEG